MTLEEARELKAGDRVLIEAVVDNGVEDDDEEFKHMTPMDNVRFIVQCNKYEQCFVCGPSAIREKIEPERRKFRKGDVVRWRNEVLAVIKNEEESGVLVSSHFGNSSGVRAQAHKLTLICAAEDRSDRKVVSGD